MSSSLAFFAPYRTIEGFCISWMVVEVFILKSCSMYVTQNEMAWFKSASLCAKRRIGRLFIYVFFNIRHPRRRCSHWKPGEVDVTSSMVERMDESGDVDACKHTPRLIDGSGRNE